MTADPLHLTMACTAALGVVYALLGSALTGRLPALPQRALDLGVSGALVVWGLHEVWRLHTLANPAWLPLGQDSPEYLAYLVDAVWPGQVGGLGYRYHLYPWLAAPLVHHLGYSPHQAGLTVATTALGLLPAAVWAVGAQLSPRPVALAAALLVPTLPPVAHLVGQPTDYALAALLQTCVLAGGLGLARTGGLGAALGLGLSLGGLLLATPKALVVALVALPLGLLALPWAKPGRAALGLGLLVLPAAGAWELYARLDPPRHSLEHAVMVVELDHARHDGEPLSVADYGFTESTPQEQRGTWRLGDPRALRALPQTLRFLLRRPAALPGPMDRLPGAELGYAQALGWSRWPRAMWGVLGLGLAGAAWRAGRWRGVLAAATGLLLVGGSAWGALRLPFVERYALPVLVLLPALVLAGAATPGLGLEALRRWRRGGQAAPGWLWVLVPLGVGVLAWGGPSPTPAERFAAQEAQRRAEHPLNNLLQLRAELGPGDAVIDATSQAGASALLMGRAELRRAQLTGLGPPYSYAGGRAARQYLVLECAVSVCLNPDMQQIRALLDADPRFRPVLPWIWEDLEPLKSAQIGVLSGKL